MWLDRAKWQLECMPEKFFLSLSLPSTEPAILPRKNLMFLESQTSHWANMDPKTGCNKMRLAERYRPSLIGSGVRSWVQSLWPLNIMVRFFLTENVNDMKNRSYKFNMSCKINLTEWLKAWSPGHSVPKTQPAWEIFLSKLPILRKLACKLVDVRYTSAM